MTNDARTRHLAKCSAFDVAIDDHGWLSMRGHFNYTEEGSAQGFGYGIDTDFLRRFLKAIGVRDLRSAQGKSCWVTSSPTRIHKIEPLHKGEGEPFDIDEWVEEKQEARDD